MTIRNYDEIDDKYTTEAGSELSTPVTRQNSGYGLRALTRSR